MSKSPALTKSANGQQCSLRISCDCNETTTVFCHAPNNLKGIASKAPDYWGAYACCNCHDVVDRRGHEWKQFTGGEIAASWLRAIAETQAIMVQKGLLIFTTKKTKPKASSKTMPRNRIYG